LDKLLGKIKTYK